METNQTNRVFVTPGFLFLLLFLGIAASTRVSAVTVVNPGFNDMTGWSSSAVFIVGHPGGTAPWTWTSAGGLGVDINSDETVLPTEGTGLAITYAGAVEILQTVNIPTAGNYLFSVDANALFGTADITVHDGSGGILVLNRPLVNGLFGIVAGSESSTDFSVPTTDGWQTFTWMTALDAGLHQIGIENRLAASYWIAYDNFSITSLSEIPVPAALWLFATALIGLAGYGKSRKAA